jgi:hypothetical protein
MSCRIWYSISRLVYGNLHRGKPMIARSARSPSSPTPSARRANTSYPLGLKRALGLDRVAA